ncbi:hypothetical protein LTR56_027517 [Elasticomyces elasticus]|nr:hypothetical protein LTR56_027517 [Elasticomyces elasticus]KAK3617359.1 hypothetical protein LTR22_026762 [Elasticomyces elasticus]KAK5733071.1 hypothetical protein LTS12_027008 [Elasticomyces elasticus]
MASPFQAEEYLRTDSSNGGESDFKHLSPTYVAESQAMHNWLGKLYLAYRLGKIASEAAPPSATQDELHIDMMRRMIDFPYAARLESVQHRDFNQRPPPSRQPAFSRYSSALGNLLCRDDPSSGNDLELLILGPQAQPSRPSTMANAQALPEAHHSSITVPRQPPTNVEIDVARYTMALKEYGDCTGQVPVYEFSQLSLDPPRFRARVTIRGSSFDESASTKRQAKHLASQRACTYLSLSL